MATRGKRVPLIRFSLKFIKNGFIEETTLELELLCRALGAAQETLWFTQTLDCHLQEEAIDFYFFSR